ncbi:hypothetical protein [Terrisporobacter sp.]|uniref:hypothetical protein n=1 Tax=Terrisporobacter sp. TaxID=1965305 RepID=UPI002604605B|nr:hypothetical protein [Terrisporobacter sp.]
MKEYKIFKCYSPKLKKFLYDNGLIYDMVCKDIKTDKTCWVYVRCDELNKLLTQWKVTKPTN